MADTISILHDINKIADQFRNRLSRSNIMFGVAKTLTDLARLSQGSVIRDLPRHFTIRRSWVAQGIRIQAATKSRLESTVYSIDSGGRRGFMTLQEFGGDKTSHIGGHVAIPMRAVRPNPSAVVPLGMRPKNLLRYGPSKGARQEGMKQRAMAFKVQSKTRPGVEWIVIKQGGKYVPGWLLVPRAHIKSTHFLRDPSVTVIKRQTGDVLLKNLKDAVK